MMHDSVDHSKHFVSMGKSHFFNPIIVNTGHDFQLSELNVDQFGETSRRTHRFSGYFRTEHHTDVDVSLVYFRLSFPITNFAQRIVVRVFSFSAYSVSTSQFEKGLHNEYFPKRYHTRLDDSEINEAIVNQA